MPAPLRFRVFLPSPGDVTDERGLARQVLHHLPKERALHRRVMLEEISWDDPGAPVPLSAHLTPQAAIDLRRPKSSECDVVVVILWARMGTPLPEDRRKPDGTPYLSGTEHEFLEAMAAARSHGRPTVLVYRRTEVPDINLADPERDEKIRQYEAVKTFFEGFRNADGSLRWSYEPYGSPSEFREKLERQLRELVTARLEEALAQQAPHPSSNRPPASVGEETEALWQGNPYRGLDAFRPEDAPIFFGRAPEIDALIARVGSARVVAVIGPSGSGKSSLVAAGLLPRLAAGALPGSADWLVVRFTPAEAGEDPFRALALRLWPHGGASQASVDGLAERLRSEPGAIEAWAVEALSGRPASSRLLLFADQFEELFTPRVGEPHRAPFVALIQAIADAARARLVLTLRADYYEHCTRYESLANTLREGSFPLAMPGARALSEMIERPARVAGLLREPGLVDAILKDAGTEPGALALVEFTLERLYDARADGRLTHTAYRSFDGVGGAVAIQGERAVQDPDGRVDESALARVFRALAGVDASGGAVRKRARLEDFAGPERLLVERLIAARLLVTDRDAAGAPWVEVAHEAVLRHWRRFHDWLDGNRAFLLWRQRLRMWAESGSLLRDAPLAEASAWFDARADELDECERAFIDRSLDAARRSVWRRRGSVILSLVLLAGLSLWQYLELEAERERRRPIYREDDWVLIQPGEFQMGSPASDDEADPFERPQHPVRIAQPFKLARHEVTFEEYDPFAYATGRRPSSDEGYGEQMSEGGGRRRLPVINVSWDDARAYAAWLSEGTGKRFRLPTEAEWEYAARAVTPTKRFWGDDAAEACRYANVFDRRNAPSLKERLTGVNWEAFACEDAYADIAPVGSFQPNPWGLHDMLGNVFEWVQDCWHDSYEGAPADGTAWEGGDCARRLYRGGSWIDAPGDVRSAHRVRYKPGDRGSALGFRLAQDL